MIVIENGLKIMFLLCALTSTISAAFADWMTFPSSVAWTLLTDDLKHLAEINWDEPMNGKR